VHSYFYSIFLKVHETDFRRPNHITTNGMMNGASSLTRMPNEDNTVESVKDTRISSCDCAICLETFQVDDRLVWSQNRNCTHAFHMSCLVELFSTLDDVENATCPCCRRSFCTDLPDGI
jgi:hypothetical protein